MLRPSSHLLVPITMSFALPALAGCTTHDCDPVTVALGRDGGGAITPWRVESGSFIWQSSSVQGSWLDFPGNYTYAFTLPPLPMSASGAMPDVSVAAPRCLLASDQAADGVAPDNYSGFVGELAEVEDLTIDEKTGIIQFKVFNPTCARYLLYVEVLIPLKSDVIVDASDG